MVKLLLDEIEEKRSQLNEFALSGNLTDPEIVQLSQQLDFLLNQYHDLCYLQDKLAFLSRIHRINELAG